MICRGNIIRNIKKETRFEVEYERFIISFTKVDDNTYLKENIGEQYTLNNILFEQYKHGKIISINKFKKKNIFKEG